MSSTLKSRLTDDTKAALKAGEKKTVAALRLVLAAFKQYEVDNRAELDDPTALGILNKLAKQRRESIEQYEKADRGDLIAQEQFELDLLGSYLPAAANDADIDLAIDKAIVELSASSMKDMGKVMGVLKQEFEGRADFAEVSKKVKAALSGS